MQGRPRPTRRARIQHALPWLAEPLELDDAGDEGANPDTTAGLPPHVVAWSLTLDKPETRRAYLRDVAGFLRHLGIGRDDQLVAVDRRRVAAWRDELESELDAGTLSYGSCKRRMSAVSSLYDHLNAEGFVITNPLRRMRRPRRPEAERRRERRRTSPCPLTHCPAATAEVVGNRVTVPELVARLLPSRGRQLTLW